MKTERNAPEKQAKTAGTISKKRAKKKNKERGKFLREIVSDNKFLFFVSLLLAFFAWCLVSAYASPEVERTIGNVPVTIPLSGTGAEQLGYQTFGNTDYYVDVVVKGPKYQLSESNFGVNNVRVTASVLKVESPGLKSLALNADIVDASQELEIVSVSQKSISVYFDVQKQAQFTIEPKLVLPDDVEPVPEGYLLDTPILSVSTVTVVGPATEIPKIKHVFAEVSLEKQITANTSAEAKILMVDGNGSPPEYSTCDISDVDVTLPVLKIRDLPIGVSFINQPLAYLQAPLDVTVSPDRVRAAVPADTADQLTAIDIGSVNFSDINNTVNNYAVAANEVDQAQFLDNDLDRIVVTVDASMMAKKTFDVKISSDTVTTTNLPEGFGITYANTKPMTVTVIGPETSLNELSDSGIYAEVDLSDVAVEAGNVTVDARFYVKTLTDCWCYGSYQIDAVITGSAAETTAG